VTGPRGPDTTVPESRAGFRGLDATVPESRAAFRGLDATVPESRAAFRVALTFDAEHPDRRSRHGVAEDLLTELDRRGVTASFFIQGRWAEAYPDTAKRIPGAGHFVGNHSFYHARMPLLSDRGLAEDVRAAEAVIRDVVGVDPRPWFRCPFGAGVDDPRVISGLKALGYRNVGWDVVATDWEPDRAAEIEQTVVEGVLNHGDGAIVLLHTWPAGTLAALPGIARQLRDRGAEFVRVDQLERIPGLRVGDVAPVPE
jgi:peptidoglycan-N-acetylglucosamine deacetylase